MDIQGHTFLLPVLSEFMNTVKRFEFLPPSPESDGHGFAERREKTTSSPRALIVPMSLRSLTDDQYCSMQKGGSLNSG